MSSNPVLLLCGVPGSGKTTIARQLSPQKCLWVAHDDFPVSDYHKALIQAARRGGLPVVGEAPFRVSVLIEQLEAAGVPVQQYWIIEPEEVVRERYEARDHKPILKMHLTNLSKYAERTRGLPNVGTAQEVLEMLCHLR